jgi:2-oxoisovalerate dehydrogenase E1 component
MFGDFLTLAADQIINHAAKFRYMYNEQVSIPLIVRTPMGGKRGYGPTHSQSLEKHFLGIPDTQVLAIHHRYDPGVVYDRLLANIDRLTIVIENKRLYSMPVSHEAPLGFIWEHTDEPFPTSRLRPDGMADVSILCYGGILADVEQAIDRLFEEHDVICEAICPIRLYPLRLDPIEGSLRQSRRLLVVEEGQSFAAFGSETICQLMERSPNLLRTVRRLAAPQHAIASSGPLESAELPGSDHVVAAVLEMMANG